ncbi:hypothetical protein A2886_00375 [candidate division WWE3 bacterium RIFCSPHIGHO2_01_FULL_42_13]|uniref:Uncharacterized protein n=1 Tax=candidate division WWE3 bacterium RIFCSPHIGHO2_01_FULL_42_13 TaxID=1802617 RepID=A0A1F4US94_UNCKA|nr:MAG: hypothetical protein A2886_00375 [candidate division WWE3 bacterium RIFCSPHIGHO2_01_FULL_42_13]
MTVANSSESLVEKPGEGVAEVSGEIKVERSDSTESKLAEVQPEKVRGAVFEVLDRFEGVLGKELLADLSENLNDREGYSETDPYISESSGDKRKSVTTYEQHTWGKRVVTAYADGSTEVIFEQANPMDNPMRRIELTYDARADLLRQRASGVAGFIHDFRLPSHPELFDLVDKMPRSAHFSSEMIMTHASDPENRDVRGNCTASYERYVRDDGTREGYDTAVVQLTEDGKVLSGREVLRGVALGRLPEMQEVKPGQEEPAPRFTAVGL